MQTANSKHGPIARATRRAASAPGSRRVQRMQQARRGTELAQLGSRQQQRPGAGIGPVRHARLDCHPRRPGRPARRAGRSARQRPAPLRTASHRLDWPGEAGLRGSVVATPMSLATPFACRPRQASEIRCRSALAAAASSSPQAVRHADRTAPIDVVIRVDAAKVEVSLPSFGNCKVSLARQFDRKLPVRFGEDTSKKQTRQLRVPGRRIGSRRALCKSDVTRRIYLWIAAL